MEYIINKKVQRIFFIVAVILAIALLAGALIRTNIYNKTERYFSLKGEELSNLPDYSELAVTTTKTAGGWNTVIGGRTFDAYTLNPAISNATGKEISNYRVKYTVSDDVYFITGWCGTIEFHQKNSEGKMVCQTIDLRNRPDIYLIDTYASGTDTLIPLHAGDWFIYVPSTTEGEAPIADGKTVTPGIMYYEPHDATEDVFTFVPQEKSTEVITASDISLVLSARTSTWTKVFDLEHTGSTTPDYQAYTYDLQITNNSSAVLSDYTVKICFGTEVYLASAWTGSVTIHQGELSEYIKDLRDFDATKISVKTVNIDGEDFVYIGENDYVIYTPNTSVTNPEIPIEQESHLYLDLLHIQKSATI